MRDYNFSPTAGNRPTLQEIEQLALAVSDGRARYYKGDGTNSAGEWARSVSEAARSGRPFFVNIRPRILPLDADDADQSAALDPIIAMLESFGIGPVPLWSGQPNRKHLFALVVDPALKMLAEQMAREHEIDVRTNQMIRPLLSPHRDPQFQPRLIGLTVAAAIKALTVPVTTRRIIPARHWRLLEKGDTDRRWLTPDRKRPDRSRAIASFVSQAIRTGFNDDSIKRLLGDPAHRLGEKVREKDQHGEGEEWLDLTIREERDWLADNPRIQIDAVLDGIAARALDCPEHWRRPEGAIAFAVLLFYLSVARKARSLDFGAARRDVMAWTGVANRQTVRRADRKLVALEYIRRLKPDPDRKTARLELRPSWSAGARTIQGSAEVLDLSTVLDPSTEKGVIQNGPSCGGVPEVFRVHKGLGLSAFHLWLVADGRTETEIAKALHTRPHRVRPRLATLEGYGLVGRTDDGRYWRFADQIDAAAERRGVRGARFKQSLQVLVERTLFHDPNFVAPDFDVPALAPLRVWYAGTLRLPPKPPQCWDTTTTPRPNARLTPVSAMVVA